MKVIQLLLVLVVGTSLHSCAKKTDTWTPLELEAADAAIVERVERSQAAIGDFGSKLMATLGAELADGGPVAAIVVCRDAAPRLAREVGAQHGVALGRTSTKLRNPDSQAPAWAEASVHAGEPDTKLWIRGDGSVGVLRPIHLMGLCVSCHGPKDALDEELKLALGEHYPDDRATGFAEGDLRGHFWAQCDPD